jgi:hypothetical protein
MTEQGIRRASTRLPKRSESIRTCGRSSTRRAEVFSYRSYLDAPVIALGVGLGLLSYDDAEDDAADAE